MKNLFLLLGLFFVTGLSAQTSKIEGPLQEFVQTSFMLRFKDVKIEAEAAVGRFKLQAHQLDPEDVQRVQTGYEQSAYRFNQLLFRIKSDFLNAKKVKYISQFPDDYLRTLELELHQLSEFYAMHFLQPLADATAAEVDGSATLLLIVELVGLTKGLFNYFSQVRQHSRQFSERYLQEHLIQPFQFRTWNAIGAEGDLPPSPAQDIYAPDLMQPPSLDPLLQETTNLLTPNPAYPTDPYQDTDTYDDWLDQQGDGTEGIPPPGTTTTDSTLFIVTPAVDTLRQAPRVNPKGKNR